jgi:hypothetical protein
MNNLLVSSTTKENMIEYLLVTLGCQIRIFKLAGTSRKIAVNLN